VKPLAEQNLYELLEVPFDAPESEIVRAWERVEALYGPGSLATYTLISPDEAALLGRRLEEALTVLLDPAARKAYDARLSGTPAPRAGRAEDLSGLPAPARLPPIIPPLAPTLAAGAPPAPEVPERPLPSGEAETGLRAASLGSDNDVGFLPEEEDLSLEEDASAAPSALAEPEAVAEASVPAEEEGPPAPDLAAEAGEPLPLALAPPEEAPAAALAAAPPSAEPEAASGAPVGGEAPPIPLDLRVPAPAEEPPAPAILLSVLARPAPIPLDTPLPVSPPFAAVAEAAGRGAPSPASAPRPTFGERMFVPEGAPYTGEVLRRAREARGLTLQQMGERTKIARYHLEHLEADDYGRLPAVVYLRGMLMAVAKELRLDGQKVARSYLQALSDAAAAPHR